MIVRMAKNFANGKDSMPLTQLFCVRNFHPSWPCVTLDKTTHAKVVGFTLRYNLSLTGVNIVTLVPTTCFKPHTPLNTRNPSLKFPLTLMYGLTTKNTLNEVL